jgi:hypothetical protein
MKATKSFLAAAASAALAFTFSGCSGDDSGDNSKSNNGELVSCRFGLDHEIIEDEHGSYSAYYTFSQSENKFCSEVLIADLEKEGVSIDYVRKDCYGGDGTAENSKAIFSNEPCPSESVMDCKIKAEQYPSETSAYSAHLYYYGKAFVNPKKPCGKL